jgi:hypothetical protein
LGCGYWLTQGGHDVGKDVLDLVSHGKENDDDYDRNQNQDEGVLNHSLAALRAVSSGRINLNSPPLRAGGLGSMDMAEHGYEVTIVANVPKSRLKNGDKVQVGLDGGRLRYWEEGHARGKAVFEFKRHLNGGRLVHQGPWKSTG